MVVQFVSPLMASMGWNWRQSCRIIHLILAMASESRFRRCTGPYTINQQYWQISVLLCQLWWWCFNYLHTFNWRKIHRWRAVLVLPLLGCWGMLWMSLPAYGYRTRCRRWCWYCYCIGKNKTPLNWLPPKLFKPWMNIQQKEISDYESTSCQFPSVHWASQNSELLLQQNNIVNKQERSLLLFIKRSQMVCMIRYWSKWNLTNISTTHYRY